MYTVLFSDEAMHAVKRLDAKTKSQIRKAVDRIALDPFEGKELKAELRGMYSYRSGDYRIVYSVEKERIVVMILTVGHRKDVYKQVTRKKR